MWIESVLAAVVAASAPVDGVPLYTSPYFHTMGVAAGLPSSRVYKTVQDRDGYIWIATHDGLARYDGSSFRVYRHDPKDPGSLDGNVVSALFIDRGNRLWCGGEDSGLNMLDIQREHFVHFRHDAKIATSLAGDDVWVVTQDAAGAIWVGGYAGGLSRLSEDTNAFIHFRHDQKNPQSIASDNVLNATAARDGALWVGSDAGLDLLDADGHARHVDFSALPGEGAVNAIALVDAGDGSLMVGTRRGLVRVGADLKANVIAAATELSDRVVYGVVEPANASGELWIGTRRGLNLRGTRGDLAAYTENAAVPGSLPGDTVFEAMRDRDGGFWFATFEGGVAQLPAQWRNFALYRNDPGDAQSLSANRVQGLSADAQGSIWSVNSAGGIDRLDTTNGHVERYGARWGSPDKALWSVLADSSGQLWVGHTRGLRVYDLQSGKFSDLPIDGKRADALAPGLVDQLLQADDGAIWVSSNGGAIERIDPASHHIERFDENNAGLRSAAISQLGFDHSGALLAASVVGLDRFDAASKRFVPVAGAPTLHVLAFAFAGDGSLWLHVLGALEHYRVAGKVLEPIERIDDAAGWPSLTAGGMRVDDRGSVWVSSARGLWRFDPKSRAIRVYTTGDGLASSEFNQRPLIQRNDGAIFGGTLAGIVGFNPSRIVENAASPAPLLDGIRVRRHGRDVPLDAVAATLKLDWDDRDLRLQAHALSFANPAATRYQWRLSGLDSDWVDSGNRGEREFSQLPPGQHRLKLRAANAGGVWSEAALPFIIDQAAPPWATRWAFAAYVALLAVITWLAFRGYRARVVRRYALALTEQQRQFAERASAAKTSFLVTMGHEIRTPMTGVLGMTELLLHTPLDTTQRGYAEIIQNSGRMMLRLVNDSLDLARIEAGKFELDDAPIDLHALLAEIAALEQPLAQRKDLAWELAIASDAPRHVRGDRMRIQQIFLNLANNAIKFTDRGKVAIALARTADGAAEFRVSDTGPGISAATHARLFQRFEQAEGAHRHGGSGLGLAICRELVARMGGEISLESTPGVGSTFSVHLPLVEIAEGMPVETAQAVAGLDSKSRVLQLLLVEDDATAAAVVRGLLEMQGHAVMHVLNGLAALSEIASAHYDLALLDLDLPGIDGFALARMLRTREAQSGSARTPLIGISARSVGDEEALCLAAGMDAFLRKPVTGKMLAELIADQIRPLRGPHAQHSIHAPHRPTLPDSPDSPPV